MAPPDPNDREAFKAWAAYTREQYEAARATVSERVLKFYRKLYGIGSVK